MGCKDAGAALRDSLKMSTAGNAANPEKMAAELHSLLGREPLASKLKNHKTVLLEVLRAPECRRSSPCSPRRRPRPNARSFPRFGRTWRTRSRCCGAVASAVDGLPEGSSGRQAGSGSQERDSGDSRQDPPTAPPSGDGPADGYARDPCQILLHADRPEGEVSLTAGKCGAVFSAILIEAAERPFSEKEESTRVLPGNVRVPDQFALDAPRAGTPLRGARRDAMIDKSNWMTLTPEERGHPPRGGLHPVSSGSIRATSGRPSS